MSVVTESKPARKWAMPDTLVIIFFVAILTSIATWVVPVGMFDSQEVQYQVDGQTKTRKVVDPHSFRIVTNEAGEAQYHRVQFFTTGDERPGLMNFPFEGLTSGSKFGTAVGIIMFMLVIGGAFGIVMRTGTVDNGILAPPHAGQRSPVYSGAICPLFVRGRRIWHGRRGGRLCNYHCPADGQAGL